MKSPNFSFCTDLSPLLSGTGISCLMNFQYFILVCQFCHSVCGLSNLSNFQNINFKLSEFVGIGNKTAAIEFRVMRMRGSHFVGHLGFLDFAQYLENYLRQMKTSFDIIYMNHFCETLSMTVSMQVKDHKVKVISKIALFSTLLLILS